MFHVSSSKFRKKMKNLCWKNTVKLNFSMMKIVGIWPKEKYKFDLYSFYTIISVNLFISGHVIFHTVAVYIMRRNLKQLIGALYMSLTETLLLIKILYFIKNSKQLKKLFTTLESDIFQPKNEAQLKLVIPNLNFWIKIHRLFGILVLNTVLLFISLPILSKSVKYYRLPLEAWYPYNTQKAPNYEITYLYQCLSILFRGVASVSIDTCIAALNMYIGTQCDILCDNLKNLNKTTENSFLEILKHCVKHHQAILRFVKIKFTKKINSSFLVLLTIVINSIMELC